MPRLAELRTRLVSLTELMDIVGAMRSMSAARVQQAHDRVLSVRQYASIVETALVEAAPMLPARGLTESAGAGMVVAFGSEHGFVGAFNERVLERAAPELRGRHDQLLVVGARAALKANENGLDVVWACPAASHVGGIAEVALRVAERIAEAMTGLEFGRVILVYARGPGGASSRIVTETLLPFDLRPFQPRRLRLPAPLSNLAPRVLLDALVDELIFAQLTHVAAESFGSENAARLAAMESAYDNVAKKLDELRRLESALRQEEITTELIDIVTGAEAMKTAPGD